MTVTSSPLLPATNRFVRILMIVVVSCAVGPLVAGTAYWAQMMVTEAFEIFYPRNFTLADVPGIWAGTILLAYVVGVPYALLTSGIFALVAVLSGLRQLATALIIALIPALLYFASAASVQPRWQSIAGFAAVGSAVVALATSSSWLLTRRWHSPNA